MSIPNTKDPENRKYVQYDPELEHIPLNETEDTHAVADMINTMQKKQFVNNHHAFGGMLTIDLRPSSKKSGSSAVRNACLNVRTCQRKAYCTR